MKILTLAPSSGARLWKAKFGLYLEFEWADQRASREHGHIATV